VCTLSQDQFFPTADLCNRFRFGCRHVHYVARKQLVVKIYLCLCFGLKSALPQQAPTIRVPVRLVSVPTLVVSKAGKYVSGLSVTDFTVTDNARRVEPNLDTVDLPVSVAILFQMDADVRDYLPFIARTGTLLENSIAAANGEIAVLSYNDEITVEKPFESADVSTACRKLSASGHQKRLLDASSRAVSMLRERAGARSRVLILIGQPADSGSGLKAEQLASQIEHENIQVFALSLPLMGKSFISDSFRLSGLGSQVYGGGYQASIELTRVVPALKRAAEASTGADVFSLLTVATGGIQIHFRKQSQLENALIAIGEALRSRYFLSFTPDGSLGPHKLTVEVRLPGAIVYSRPGYQLLER